MFIQTIRTRRKPKKSSFCADSPTEIRTNTNKLTEFLQLLPTGTWNPFARENCCNFVVAQNNDDGKWWTFLLQLSRCFWGDSKQGSRDRGRCLLHFVENFHHRSSFISQVYGSKQNENCNPFLSLISLFNKKFLREMFFASLQRFTSFLPRLQNFFLVQPNLAEKFNWKEFL